MPSMSICSRGGAASAFRSRALFFCCFFGLLQKSFIFVFVVFFGFKGGRCLVVAELLWIPLVAHLQRFLFESTTWDICCVSLLGPNILCLL